MSGDQLDRSLVEDNSKRLVVSCIVIEKYLRSQYSTLEYIAASNIGLLDHSLEYLYTTFRLPFYIHAGGHKENEAFLQLKFLAIRGHLA